MNTKFYKAVWIICFALIAGTFTGSLYGFRFEETRKRNFPMDAGGSLTLKALRGNIEIRTHSDNEIKVTAIVMSDKDEDIKKTVITFDTIESALLISENPKTIPAGVNIEYYIKVPQQLRIISINSYTGEIKSRGAYAELNLKTGTGEIDFKGSFTTGIMTTANGQIHVNVRGELTGDLSLRSSNGAITLTLDSDSDFTLEGSTFTGNIRSDFPAEEESDVSGAVIKATVNKGTHKVKIKSTNGNISLVKK